MFNIEPVLIIEKNNCSRFTTTCKRGGEKIKLTFHNCGALLHSCKTKIHVYELL